MSHTKGEWKAEGVGGTHSGGSNKQHPCFNGRIVAGKQEIISQGNLIGVQGKTPIEAEANARLIAAAPDLLRACQECVKVFDEAGIGADFLVNAIKKAKGE